MRQKSLDCTIFYWSEIRNVTIIVKDSLLYMWGLKIVSFFLKICPFGHSIFSVVVSPDFANFCFQNRLNVTKTIRKFSIDSNLRPTGSEFHSGEISALINHGDEAGEELVEDSVSLTGRNFDTFSHQ